MRPLAIETKTPARRPGLLFFRSLIFLIVVFVVMLLDHDHFVLVVFVVAPPAIVPVAIMIAILNAYAGDDDSDFLGLNRAADDRRSDEGWGSEQTKSNERKENFPHHTLLGFLSLRLESQRAR
jgi:hypothetical protein